MSLLFKRIAKDTPPLKCPFCSYDLNEFLGEVLDGGTHGNLAYACPHCRRILGIGSR